MTTRYEITVKPKDKTDAGWFIQYSRWLSIHDPEPVMHTITNWSVTDGKFTARLDLDDGVYGLVCQLAMSGRKVEIDLSPQAPILQPPNSKWPFVAEVPDDRSQALRVRYFRVGANQ